MNKSESLANIAAALSAFQGESQNVYKGKAGHGYKYAELSAILDSSRELLAKNGLSVVQMPATPQAGYVAIETTVLHSSGEWLEQVYEMPIPENKRNSAAQNMGSAITYARRYALAAALGVAQTDDDASLHGPAPTKADYYKCQTQAERNAMWNNLPQDVQAEIIKEHEQAAAQDGVNG